MRIASKYMFTLELDFGPTLVGNFPDGRRIDVRYGGKVTTDADKYAKAWGRPYRTLSKDDLLDGSEDAIEWRGLEGQVISGTDSVVVRRDVVAAFAGRLTIRARDRYLLNAQLAGAVDLRELANEPRLTLQQVYENKTPELPLNFSPSHDVDLVLGMSFEGATSEQEWAAEELQQKAFFRYQRLLRGTFATSGRGTFKNGLIVSAELDVVALLTTADEANE